MVTIAGRRLRGRAETLLPVIRVVHRPVGIDDISQLSPAPRVHAVAMRLAYQLRDCNITFFEEPVFADDIPGLARFRAANILPCASGEHEYTRFGARDLISNNCIDYLQSDISRCGGFTEGRKMVSFAQAYNISYAPHGFDFIHCHLLSAYANGVFLESLFMFNELVEKTFTNAPKPVNGMMHIPDKPGLGIDLNYKNLEKFGSV